MPRRRRRLNPGEKKTPKFKKEFTTVMPAINLTELRSRGVKRRTRDGMPVTDGATALVAEAAFVCSRSLLSRSRLTFASMYLSNSSSFLFIDFNFRILGKRPAIERTCESIDKNQK